MALAVALVSHMTSYLFSSILGAIGLWYFGLSFSSMQHAIVSTEMRIADDQSKAAAR
jgi:hypothetical protein